MSDPDDNNPDFRPGGNVQAAVARMLLWMEQYPDDVNVAARIGSSNGFITDGWPYRMYAVDRRDLAAVLRLVQKLPDFQIYTFSDASASVVCERCDTNITHGDADPRLYSLVEAAGLHTCDPEREAAVERDRAARKV